MNLFQPFASAVERQINRLVKCQVYKVKVKKDELYELYLKELTEQGANPIFKTRTEHDCQCCRNFIRDVGAMVAFIDGKMLTIWDVTDVDPIYQNVADRLAQHVRSKHINNVFLHYQAKIGMEKNSAMFDMMTTVTFHHFHAVLPAQLVMDKAEIPAYAGNVKTNRKVFERTMKEIHLDAVNTALELTEQNTLYRGTQHKASFTKLISHITMYRSLTTNEAKEQFCWEQSMRLGDKSKLRNTSIGTLLVDLSEGLPLNDALKKYETMTAPSNYQRPKAAITQGMIDKAQKEVEALGIEDSLQRRYAKKDDLTINNVLFANRDTKKIIGGNIFDTMKSEVPAKPKNLDKVETIPIDTFLQDVLPKAEAIELFLDSQHTNNLVSLIAPVEPTAKPIFQWDNNFSWSYNGEVTDSIKQRVKAAGGSVTGHLRASLAWFNRDDLDIHLILPNGVDIGYDNAYHKGTKGQLDVDMNVNNANAKRDAVENITFPDKLKMLEGHYKVKIINFTPRESKDVGFEVQLACDGYEQTFVYDQRVSSPVTAVEFDWTKKDGIKNIRGLPTQQSSKDLWGVKTNQFIPVSMVMNSPNHWDEQKCGNKHWFFVLEGCTNEDSNRGIYNEFLKSELKPHRKVFEVLGSKLKVPPSTDQLSGLGFSSTQRNDVVCKIKGSFDRTVKITF